MIRQTLITAIAVAALAGSALAADLPSRQPPPAFLQPPLFSWTGVYIGGQIGYQWGPSRTQDFSLLTGALGTSQPNYNADGVVGGAHIGYNYQINQFVVGAEGDVDGSSFSGHGTSLAGLYNFTTRIDVEGSVRARAGYAWDRALIYATGGAAFASIRNSYTFLTTGNADDLSTTRAGWTAGAGVEYAVTNNWSVRAEYRYTDFGAYSDALTNSSGGLAGEHKHETENSVRVGFSYKFNMYAPPPPVIAKY